MIKEQSKKYIFVLFVLTFFCIFIYNIKPVEAFSVGVTPSKIKYSTLNNESIVENEIILFNPNNYSIEYMINSCNNSLFDYLPSGIVHTKAYRVVKIRYNNDINSNISDCFIDVMFSKGNYKTAFSIDVDFSIITEIDKIDKENKQRSNILGSFWNEDVISNDNIDKKTNNNYIFIIIATTVFIILVIAVILYR